MLSKGSGTERSLALCRPFSVEGDSVSAGCLFIYSLSLTLECHFAIIAFDLVIISPWWSVGPVSPRPTVFRTFLSLPFYDFIAHHCAVFFMFILLGIYQAREICRFVVFCFFLKSNPGKFWQLFFGDVFTLSASPLPEIPATRMADRCWLCVAGHWDSGTFKHSIFLFRVSV